LLFKNFLNWIGDNINEFPTGIKLNVPLLLESEDKISIKLHYHIESNQNLTYIMMVVRGIALKENYKEI
jgi:hypothetical protein